MMLFFLIHFIVKMVHFRGDYVTVYHVDRR